MKLIPKHIPQVIRSLWLQLILIAFLYPFTSNWSAAEQFCRNCPIYMITPKEKLCQYNLPFEKSNLLHTLYSVDREWCIWSEVNGSRNSFRTCPHRVNVRIIRHNFAMIWHELYIMKNGLSQVVLIPGKVRFS